MILGIITMREVECSRKIYTFPEGLLFSMIFFLDEQDEGWLKFWTEWEIWSLVSSCRDENNRKRRWEFASSLYSRHYQDLYEVKQKKRKKEWERGVGFKEGAKHDISFLRSRVQSKLKSKPAWPRAQQKGRERQHFTGGNVIPLMVSGQYPQIRDNCT